MSGSFLGAYVQAAKTVGLEPYTHLRRARLPTEGLNRDAITVPVMSFLALLDSSQRISGRPDFTLAFVRALTICALGPIGVIAAAQPTVRAGVAALCRHSRAAGFPFWATLEERGDVGVVRLSFKPLASDEAPERSDLALGVALRVIQSMLGEDWRPEMTTMARPAPTDPGPYVELFGPVTFDQDAEAMTLASADLSALARGASPELALLAERQLGRTTCDNGVSATEEVAEVIRILLARGRCGVEMVAEFLGVDRRSIHRRLARDGASFSALVQRVRRDKVLEQLATRGQPLSAVAETLGFSGLSSFSRWFRQTFGIPASRWRPRV